MTKAYDWLKKRTLSADECGPLCRMNIGVKINLGFGALVLTTLMVIALSILAGHHVANNMAVTADLRAPSALASTRAQIELLRMLADVRGYLALSEESYREGYLEARGRFEEELMELENMADAYDSVSEKYLSKLEALRSSFEEWSKLPDQLFVLHGDQLEREPGLKMLIKEGGRPIALIVVTTKKMIETQQGREPTIENLQLFGHMASFQASFYAMVAGLRGYATIGRDNFKFEYTTNLTINKEALDRLSTHRKELSDSQKRQLDLIAKVHQSFVPLPEKIFEWVEGDRRRMDLFLFRTKAVPPAVNMLQLLGEITVDQQNLLQKDLDSGRKHLEKNQKQLLIAGVIATLLAVVLATAFRANIVGPIRRLTRVARQVGTGDLNAVARVESNDEIGILAYTFNEMNTKLRTSLEDLERSSELIKTMFGRYLSTEVMNSLLEDPTALELGGDRRNVTIMMTDLRGFTAVSERLRPEQVVQMLNVYFDVMVDIILRYSGNINEITGDSLLVVFGAPQDMPDRTQRAIACAVEMQNAMADVNRQIRSQGLPELEMGIGLNETEVVVGNIGSSKRSKYTVVGSGVNMTSRIESYSVGGQVLISETVYQKTGEILRIDSQQDVLPKGSEAPVRIYETGGISGEYNLALEREETELADLAKAIPLRYTVLEGKKVGEENLVASCIKLSKSRAAIILEPSLKPLTNLKLNIENVDETLSTKDFYGKIIEDREIDESLKMIRFTSMPPEVAAYFHAFLQHAVG